MKYHRIRRITILLAGAALLASCEGGSYTIINGDVDARTHSISGEYQEFSGTYFRKVRFDKHNTVMFELQTATEEGSLEARVLLPDDRILLELKGSGQTSEKHIEAPESGVYTIVAEGDGHRGSFSLRWQEE